MFELITGLGDSVFLIPASALLFACCLYARSTRAAVIWLSALGLCAGLTIILKIGFRTCGAEVPVFDLWNPSGHASLSTTFYGCVAFMSTVGQQRWVRISILVVTIPLIAAIAITRVVLHLHTPSEVIAGLIIGVFCVAWFAFQYPPRRLLSFPWLSAAAGVAALALITHGWHIDFEAEIGELVRFFHAVVPGCR